MYVVQELIHSLLPDLGKPMTLTSHPFNSGYVTVIILVNKYVDLG